MTLPILGCHNSPGADENFCEVSGTWVRNSVAEKKQYRLCRLRLSCVPAQQDPNLLLSDWELSHLDLDGSEPEVPRKHRREP